jgi:hypothetical protein
MTPREEIERERRRQVEAEGWSAEHDDAHDRGELMAAGICYYLAGTSGVLLKASTGAPVNWPWSPKWWKPHGKRRDLVRAGALCLADRERLLRRDAGADVRHLEQWLLFIEAALEAAPRRIKRERVKGWRMPADAVSVTRPGPWGNPFVAGEKPDKRSLNVWLWNLSPGHWDGVCPDAEAAVRRFRLCLAGDEASHYAARKELTGRDLACWCELGAPCHGDVLLELANPSAVLS